jgi:NAD(P)H dehydrogenase (quinone)
MNHSKKVLVTGAAGTHGGTGGHVVDALLRRGTPVRALVRADGPRAQRLRAAGAEVVVGDFLSLGSVRKALVDVDRVFFCYPLAPGLLQATANLCAAVRESEIRGVVNVTLMMAAPDHPSPVCRDHWLSERMFDWAGVRPVHLRAGFFFENLLRFTSSDIRQRGAIVLPFGDGHAKLAWVGALDVATVAEAVLADLEAHVGQTYEITEEVTQSVRDVATMMGEALGRDISYQPLALADWLAHVSPILGSNEQLRGHVTVLGQAFASGRVIGRTNDLVRRLTNAAPQTAATFARAHAVDLTA